jgi:hypothetical protein
MTALRSSLMVCESVLDAYPLARSGEIGSSSECVMNGG